MKLSHIFSALFAVTGTVLMVAAVCLCLFFRNAEPRMTELPPEAEACARQLTEALDQGDLDAAGSLIYGQPDLGTASPSDDAAVLVWDAFLGSMDCSLAGNLYAEGAQLYQDVALTTLDISSVVGSLSGNAQILLAQKAETAEDSGALYAQSGELLPQVLDSTLQEAVSAALSQGETVTCQGRLQLIRQDSRWWAIPDRTLLSAISGGLS